MAGDESTIGALLDQTGGSIKTGPFGTKLKASEYTATGVPVISVGEVGFGRLRIHHDTPRVDETVSSRMPEFLLKAGDIVFGRKGAVERSAQVQPDEVGYFLGSDGIRIRLNDESCDPKFIAYQLQTTAHRSWMIQHAAGTTMPSLNEGIIRRIPIVLKPLAEQKAIAAVLGALDDKIELNRRMNGTLEAMTRALFQSWFIDFDPVRRNMDRNQPSPAASRHPLPVGEGRGEGRFALDPATAALFPESFQDSPIGPVPKVWKVERFDAHITADRGLSYKGEGLRDDGSGLPMHNLNSVYEGGGYKHEGLKYYAGEYREKHLLEPGDMIVTNTEQGFDHLLIGHAAIVPRCYGPKGLFSHHIYRVRFKPPTPFSPHYLVELFNNRRWHYWISGFSNGTTINMLPKDALEMPMLVVPPVELVKKFTSLAEAAHLQVEDNKQQSRTLATLRDTLLPKLLSGEMCVPAANKELSCHA